jgi:hypothetical protein
MKGTKVSVSREVWDDHAERLYNEKRIACAAPHAWYEKCDDCRDGFRYEMPIVHVDGEAAGLVHDMKRGKRLVKLVLSPEAVTELLADCDYYSDTLESGALDSDCVALARKMRGAAASIRKQLAKVAK